MLEPSSADHSFASLLAEPSVSGSAASSAGGSSLVASLVDSPRLQLMTSRSQSIGNLTKVTGSPLSPGRSFLLLSNTAGGSTTNLVNKGSSSSIIHARSTASGAAALGQHQPTQQQHLNPAHQQMSYQQHLHYRSNNGVVENEGGSEVGAGLGNGLMLGLDHVGVPSEGGRENVGDGGVGGAEALPPAETRDPYLSPGIPTFGINPFQVGRDKTC
ncbi:uncharacterized protein LOC143034928 [Oratosquilla oratoria]|uniref:uncharacterized protein LOC143034928 n=1 Tax=Oratosquilla oratoria TaxID=337810 RepID=UPI003F76E13F